MGGHLDGLVAVHDDRAIGAARHRADLHVGPHAGDSFIERVDKVESAGFLGVGEQDVDLVGDEVAPGLAVALNAEGVGECQRDSAAVVVGDAARLPVGLFGLGSVEQVPLEKGDLSGRDELGIDVFGAEQLGGAEVGVHGALAVRRDHDEAAPGRRACRGGRAVEDHACRLLVVGEHRTELIVEDLADVGGLPAEAGDAGNGVGGRPPGGLDPSAHGCVQRLCSGDVDERHRAPHQVVLGDEVLGLMAQHVDEGIADADDIDGGGGAGHGEPP